MSNWPYPRIVAHRGGGKLAPENTLAAIDVGAKYGHKMIEFDAKLSKDGEIFLLHDDNGNVTSYICNKDIYPASFGVSDNSFHAEQMGNYILRFIAYDDMYNRTVVELPFTVR